MALNTKEKKFEGGNNRVEQEPMDAGTYPARIVQVLDMGVQEQQPFKGEPKPPVQELMVTYEFADEFIKDEEGNDVEKVVAALEKAKTFVGKGKPIAIMMKTQMGAGVDFMEGSHEWHGIAPSDEQLAKALAQLPETLGDY